MSNAGSARQVLVKLHRYVCLALAPFIIIIAVTGSIITFYDELERTVNWRLHFQVEHPAALEYRRDLGVYFYLAHTSRDLSDGDTPTETDSPATAATVAIDARDGSFLAVQVPTGQRASNTITSWIIALHVTAIWGLPLQIAVSLLGIAVALITVTGVLIWWRKRKSRNPQFRTRDTRDAASLAPTTLAPLWPAQPVISTLDQASER